MSRSIVPGRKVVITGIGVISPVGKSPAEFWKNLTAGICGIGMLDAIDPAEFEVKVAAQVRGFDPCNISTAKKRGAWIASASLPWRQPGRP
jgi:3-oxoacyl-[acyl-carrier-protein] synthase II